MLYSINLDMNVEEKALDMSHKRDEHDVIKLEGWIGLPLGPNDQPRADKVLFGDRRFQSAFRETRSTGQLTPFSLEGSSELTQVLMQSPAVRGFGDPPYEAVLCPIEPTTYEDVSGILVVGVNPRRPYDTDYQSFVRTLGRTISSSLASVLLFSEQERLARAASERTLEAVEMEKRASRILFSPISSIGVRRSGNVF